MILIHGKILNNEAQLDIIDRLEHDLVRTLTNSAPLTPHLVIEACDQLLVKVLDHQFDAVLLPLLDSLNITYDMFLEHAKLFAKDSLETKVKRELGALEDKEISLNEETTANRAPLGVLLHIAAGNVDGLPAYSVIEGLLAGNINLLKLPASDNGLSILLLHELIKLEPRLQDYIYVFDVPSKELESIKKLASYSDAVIVWGGDEAIRSLRRLAEVNTKIIEWGHKLSFAYCDETVTDHELNALAHSICQSNQLLCSSVQGIYLDTESKESQLAFAKRFFDILKTVSLSYPPTPIGMRGKTSISLYHQKLEMGSDEDIFHANGVSVITKEDQELELSLLYRNVWIKRLPHQDIVKVLKPYKNHLQSVGLAVDRENHALLTKLLTHAGLVRITALGETSRLIAGEAHDGEYPLQRYSRIVEISRK